MASNIKKIYGNPIYDESAHTLIDNISNTVDEKADKTSLETEISERKAANETLTANVDKATNLANKKIDKPDENPTAVGQIFRIKQLNDDGTFVGEWASETHPVTDVQIAGTSVLSDGVANIPKAGAGIFGLVRPLGTEYGLGIDNNDGRMYTYYAHNTEINARTNAYQPITPYTLDYAVKSALCDGKGEDWTSTEQLAAQSRMGLASVVDIATNLVNKKVGYSEINNGQLLMYTDDTKGTLLATLDLPDAPVQDVQSNGSSVVSEGIATIPIATDGGGEYGLVKIAGSWTNPISMTKDGILTVLNSSTTQISDRSNPGGLLRSYHVDNIVKAALCDGKGADWELSEKKAARTRMDIEGGAWTRYVDTTLTESVHSITLSLSESCAHLRVYIKAMRDNSVNYTIKGTLYIDQPSDETNIGNALSSSITADGMGVLEIIDIDNGRYSTRGTTNGAMTHLGAYWVSHQSTNGAKENIGLINSIEIFANGADYLIGSGTQITVDGR